MSALSLPKAHGQNTAYNEALEKLTFEKNGKLATYEDFLRHGNRITESYSLMQGGPFKKLTIVAYGVARVLNPLDVAAQMNRAYLKLMRSKNCMRLVLISSILFEVFLMT